MGNNNDGKTYRCWEIDDFILKNDKEGRLTETRFIYFDNYIKLLERLYDANQILTQYDKFGNIIGVCGWARVNKEDEDGINKVSWVMPNNITTGNNLYIVFCVITTGNIYIFRKILSESIGKFIDEVYWFNTPKHKFTRRRNTLKEKYHAA